MAFKFPLKWLLPILAFGAPLVAIAFVQYRWLLELQNRSVMIDHTMPKVLVTGRVEERPDGMVWSPHRVEGVVPVSVSEPEQLGELDRATAGR